MNVLNTINVFQGRLRPLLGVYITDCTYRTHKTYGLVKTDKAKTENSQTWKRGQ